MSFFIYTILYRIIVFQLNQFLVLLLIIFNWRISVATDERIVRYCECTAKGNFIIWSAFPFFYLVLQWFCFNFDWSYEILFLILCVINKVYNELERIRNSMDANRTTVPMNIRKKKKQKRWRIHLTRELNLNVGINGNQFVMLLNLK